jgi:adenylate cyclase
LKAADHGLRTVVGPIFDFKGYTGASENMTPQALMAWVNAYSDAMTQVIMKHDGVIDDYAGDSIKANLASR